MANVSDMSDTCSRKENITNVKDEVGTSESKEGNCNGESKCKIEKEDDATSSNSEETKCTPVRFRLRTSMLNPSSFGSPLPTPTKPFVLQPPKLSQPFIKKEKEDDMKIEESAPSTPKPSEKEEKPFTPLNKSSVSFLPLGGDASTPSQTSALSAATTPSLGFVFGQNIHEKVEAATPAESISIAAAEPSPSKEPQEVTTNGTSSESLFLSQVPKESSEKTAEASKSLSEAAREYEEARAVKRRYEEVPVLTGEEEEANVIQINCKLFSWSSCSWTERGRGTLRVNDLPTSPGSHRLIVRTAGSLRVVLNTKIWSGMTVDRASSKSLRITGMDSNGVVKVFLVMASPKEMDQLQKCLEWRVNNLKKSEETSPKKIRQSES